jgi:hypothetical protein
MKKLLKSLFVILNLEMCGRVSLLGVDEAGEEDWVPGIKTHLHTRILRLHTFA